MYKSAMQRKKDAEELEEKALQEYLHLRPALVKKPYTASEVSEILGISLSTIYRHIKEGKLKAFMTNKGMWEIPTKALDEYLRAQAYRALEGKKKDK